MAYKFPEIGFDFQILVDRAVKQMDLAYAPYSNYHVGCAVLSDDGESVFVGSNIENSAYPVGVCAEKSAIAYAGMYISYKIIFKYAAFEVDKHQWYHIC